MVDAIDLKSVYSEPADSTALKNAESKISDFIKISENLLENKSSEKEVSLYDNKIEPYKKAIETMLESIAPKNRKVQMKAIMSFLLIGSTGIPETFSTRPSFRSQ